MSDMSESITEADCVLCCDLDPVAKAAMRADLIKIPLREPVCDPCVEAFSANLFASFPKTEEERRPSPIPPLPPPWRADKVPGGYVGVVAKLKGGPRSKPGWVLGHVGAPDRRPLVSYQSRIKATLQRRVHFSNSCHWPTISAQFHRC
jgi:hypothetical protein